MPTTCRYVAIFFCIKVRFVWYLETLHYIQRPSCWSSRSMVIFTFRPDDVRQTMRPSIDQTAASPVVDRAFCSKALRRLVRFSVMAENIFCRCSQFVNLTIIGRGLSPFGFPRRWLRSMLRLSTVTPSDRLHRSVTAVVVLDLGVRIHKSLKVKELVNIKHQKRLHTSRLACDVSALAVVPATVKQNDYYPI